MPLPSNSLWRGLRGALGRLETGVLRHGLRYCVDAPTFARFGSAPYRAANRFPPRVARSLRPVVTALPAPIRAPPGFAGEIWVPDGATFRVLVPPVCVSPQARVGAFSDRIQSADIRYLPVPVSFDQRKQFVYPVPPIRSRRYRPVPAKVRVASDRGTGWASLLACQSGSVWLVSSSMIPWT